MPARPAGTPPKPRRRRGGQVTNEDLEKVGLRGDRPPGPRDSKRPRGVAGGAVVGDSDDRLRIKLGEIARVRGASLPTIPGVQSLSLATRHLNGGREHFIELVQMAALNGSEDASKFLEVLASLYPSERIRANYDEVCAAAGVRPSRLVGAVTSAAMEYGADVGNLVYAASHPKVVAAGIAAALAPEGTKDREQLFQHAGFIPIPKSTSISISAHASSEAKAAAVAQSQAESTGLPSFADDIAAIGAGRPVQVLPAAPEPETFEVEAVKEPATVRR